MLFTLPRDAPKEKIVSIGDLGGDKEAIEIDRIRVAARIPC
jgi:hypothetical protein